MQELIGLYLKTRNSPDTNSQNHLDEDFLNLLAEGDLSQRESRFAVTHLVQCRQCRQDVADNLDLANALAENVELTPVLPSKNSPSIWQFLSDNLFSSTDEAVFAYRSQNEDVSLVEEDESKNAFSKMDNLPDEWTFEKNGWYKICFTPNL